MSGYTDKIDGLLDAAVEAGAVPGVAVVVSGPEGVRHEASAGQLSVDDSTPIGPNTLFRIASMTKAMVSVGILQLIEQGKLGLDQTVESVVPEFGDVQVLEGFDGDTPRLRPPASKATIRHLLTHSSGESYWFFSPDLVRYHELTGMPTIIEGQSSALGAPMVADPGTRWEYGINTDWLGQVVEKVSGKKLDEYLSENLFEPLGLSEATFDPSDEQRSRLMPVHVRMPDGSLIVPDPAVEWAPTPEFWPGGHGVYAPIADYGRFIAALLGGGELDGARILAPETVDMAFTDQLQGAPLPEVIKTAVPELSNDIPLLPIQQSWGLGFHIVLEDLEGMRRAGTGDWAGLFNCYFWIDRASGVGGAIMTQILPFFDEQVVNLALGFEQAVYEEALTPAA